MKHLFLFCILLSSIASAQKKCKISCPVSSSELIHAKVAGIKIEKQEINTNKKDIVSVFKIDEDGCPYEETYLPFNILGKKWMKRTYEKSSAKEHVFTIGELGENAELKVIQKTVEHFNEKGELVEKIHKAYSSVEEIKVERFRPNEKYYKYSVMYKVVNGDTLQIISNIREGDQQNYFVRNYKDGKWQENESSITKYDGDIAKHFKHYRDGKLIRVWSYGDDEKNLQEDLNAKEYGLPVADKKPVIDTLYSKSPTDTNYTSKPIKKGYMLLKHHSDYSYTKNPIVMEQLFYPNGLLYYHWNTAEKTRLIYSYEFK